MRRLIWPPAVLIFITLTSVEFFGGPLPGNLYHFRARGLFNSKDLMELTLFEQEYSKKIKRETDCKLQLKDIVPPVSCYLVIHTEYNLRSISREVFDERLRFLDRLCYLRQTNVQQDIKLEQFYLSDICLNYLRSAQTAQKIRKENKNPSLFFNTRHQ